MSRPNGEYREEQFDDLSDYFQGAPVGLHVTGPDGTITRTNLAELELLGYGGHADEYVGHHIAEFHADSEEVRALLDRLVAGEEITEHEATLVRRDGQFQKVLLYANTRVQDDEFLGVRCFTFPHPDDLRPDIAEVAALTDQSIESREPALTPEQRHVEYWELRDLFENAPVNLHMVGGDGLIKYASRSELAGMGYASEAYVGQHIARFHADQAVIDGMLEDLVDGRPLVNFSATLFHKDGSELPVMIYSNSRMRDGGFLNTRCFTVPVPKLRKAEVDVRKKFAWPRNEDFGFTIRGQSEPTSQANPATLALKYIASRKRPEESLGFLACVSQVLGTSQPFDAMIGEVLALSVPFLADFASVDLVSGHVAHASTPSLRMRIDGILDHLAADGEAVELSMELVRTSGKLEVRFNLSSDPGPSSERSAQLLGMGVQSLIIAPLTIRGAGRVGTMTFLRENLPSRHDFGPADSALAEECARRISFAIEVEELSSHQPGRS